MKEKSNDQRLLDLLYFAVVLFLFGAVLYCITVAKPDMTDARMIVSSETSFVLNAMGVKTDVWGMIARTTNASAVPYLSPYFDETLKNRGSYELLAKDYSQMSAVEALILNRTDVSFSTASIVNEEKNIQMDIINECVGWMGFFAVTALIIAYPRVSWRKRAAGIIIALPLMHAVNISRLVTTFASGYYYGANVMFFVHDLLWKSVLVVFALAFWMAWVEYIAKK